MPKMVKFNKPFQMRSIVLQLLLLLGVCITSSGQLQLGSTLVDTSSIASNLSVPWEILYGPDDHLWVTERRGRILRINPISKNIQVVYSNTSVVQQSETGMLGLAIHPQFPDSAFVYTVYTYLNNQQITERLVRLQYDSIQKKLINQQILIDFIKGNTTHVGSRLIFGHDSMLYMSTGDAQEKTAAQDSNRLIGKILRIQPNGQIPSKNPFPNSYVFSMGHRNPQGLVIGRNQKMYCSDHGENENDEINLLESKKNYGWPYVRGFCDNDFDFDPDPAKNELFYCNFLQPIAPLRRWTPTLAVCGLDYYQHTLFPTLHNHLLVTTLKERDLRLLKLDSTGNHIISETIAFNQTFGRIRDLCIGKSGEIYLATSNRDGRGSPISTDDRIIMIRPKSILQHPIVKPYGTNIHIAPNPTRDGYFKLQSEVPVQKICIRNMHGTWGMGLDCIDHLCNVSNLPSGLYILSIEFQNHEMIYKKLEIIH